MIASLLTLFASTALAGIPAGADIDDAVSADVTPEGFQAVADIVPGFIPTTLDVGDVSLYGSTCFLIGGYTYGVTISGLDVNIWVPENGVTITPTDTGLIWADFTVMISVNDSNNPFNLHTELICIGDNCDAWIEPFTIYARTALNFSMVDDGEGTGHEILEIVVNDPITGDEIFLDYSDLDDDKFNLDDCTIATIDDILGWFGTSIVDLVLPAITEPIDDALADLGLSELTADLGSELVIEEEMDLEGAIIDLKIEPTGVVTTAEGLRLVLGGHASSPESHQCIAKYDMGESVETASPLPVQGHLPIAVPAMYHIGAVIADDFANQLLYAVWQTGLLCQEIGGADDSLDLPLPLDTTMLTLLFGDVFTDMFPESKPILIRTVPEEPPMIALGQDDIDLEMNNFALEIFADIDGRQSKLVNVGLDIDAGMNLGFDPTLGTLDIGIDLVGAIGAHTNVNEFKPDADEDIENAVKGLLDQPLISGLIEDALADMVIGLPPIDVPDMDGDGAFDKIGVQDLVLTTAGDDEDWLGAYVWVGQVYYDDAGCGGGCAEDCDDGCDEACEEEGCAAAGCEEGCTGEEGESCTDFSEGCGDPADPNSGCDLDSGCTVAPRIPARIMVVLLTLSIVFMRRRRRD